MDNPEGAVKYKVVIAYLQALNDLLDYDGMKSILKEAGLSHLKHYTDLDPDQNATIETLHDIIAAQKCLLYGCEDLVFELGKKMAFYLFPYGKSFSDIVHKMHELILSDWKLMILENAPDTVRIKIKNSLFCSENGAKKDLMTGFIIKSLEKSFPSGKNVLLTAKEGNSRERIILKFKIEDIY